MSMLIMMFLLVLMMLTDQCWLIDAWAARYNTGLLIELTPKSEVFSFLFLAK